MDIPTLIATCRFCLVYDAETDTVSVMNKESALLNVHQLEGTIRHVPDGKIEAFFDGELSASAIDQMVDTEDGGEAYIIEDAKMPCVFWM
jgi:hypothetical protein